MKFIFSMRHCAMRMLAVIVLSLAGGAVRAQIANFIPPSPTASELGKYGDIPVGNYTGVASVSVPLYTVKSGTLTLPISISYHGQGVQVSADASWVGLGWSLNAGGVITRQINGIDDFLTGIGYVKAGSLPPLAELNSLVLYANHGIIGAWPPPPTLYSFTPGYPEAYEQCELSSHGTLDTQPDIFFYNFLNYSGKLIFQKQSGGRLSGLSVDQNNLRFIYDLGTQQWEVTDPNGVTYFFHTAEVSRSRTSLTPLATPVVEASEQSNDMITAWYLDKIESPGGDEITFEYNRTGRWIVSPSYVSQQFARQGEMSVNSGPGLALTDVYAANRYSASGTYTDEPYLKQINFSNGHIVFARHANERLDREKWNLSGNTVNPRLSYFEVFDTNNRKVKLVEFAQSYFRDDKINATDKQLYLRLKLDLVAEAFADSTGTYAYLPPHVFTYNATPLPSKKSFSTDQWGYYNGANNDAIRGYKFFNLPSGSSAPGYYINQQLTDVLPLAAPRFNHIDESPDLKIFMMGANRDVNPQYLQAGILTSMQYPTGGITRFTYEPNDFWNYSEPDFTEVTHLATDEGVDERTFTLTESTFVFLKFVLDHYAYQSNSENNTIMWNMTAQLQKSDGSAVIKFIPAANQIGDQYGSNDVPHMESYVSVLLAPGTYKLKTLDGNYPTLNLSLEARYLVPTSTVKKLGGGLRIKAVENFETAGGILVNKKTYSYGDSGFPAGRLLGVLRNFYDQTKMMYDFLHPNYYNDCCYLNAIQFPIIHSGIHNVVTSSSNIIPMASSAQGSSVGYATVTVRSENEAGSSLGRSVYQYRNLEQTSGPIFMAGLPQRTFIENGQPLKEYHYNQADALIQEKTFTYSKNLDTDVQVDGMMTYKSYYDYPATDGTGTIEMFPWQDLPVFAAPFSYYSEWWTLSSVTDKIFDEAGTNPQVITTSYQFNNALHKQATLTGKYSSTGETELVRAYYPGDSPSGIATAPATLTRMLDDNLLNQPLKTEVTVNGTLVSGTINNFTVDANSHVTQVNSQSLATYAGTYKTNLEFQQYDASGRMLQLRLADNMNVSYLWAYNTDMPIVKGENVDYATLKSAVEAAAGTVNLEAFWNAHSSGSYSDLVWKSFNATLRANPALQGARITTYTYIPLSGMTSFTDENGRSTFYEYDQFKRLRYMRNHDGEILSKSEYAFRN